VALDEETGAGVDEEATTGSTGTVPVKFTAKISSLANNVSDFC
jgi:hypothetical protein